MSRFLFGTNNPQRMLQQASHHVKSNLSRREGGVWGKVVSPGTIVKWSQDILFSHWVFFHHGVTWTSNILQLLMHFVDLWSINKVDMVCLWASLAQSQSTKKWRNSSHQTATFGASPPNLWASKQWGVIWRPDTVPRFFLEPWDFLAGNGSPKMSWFFFFWGGVQMLQTRSLIPTWSFQSMGVLTINPQKNEQNSMITNPLSLPLSQVDLRCQGAASQSYQVHSGARCLWVFQEFQRYMFYIHLKLKDVLEYI